MVPNSDGWSRHIGALARRPALLAEALRMFLAIRRRARINSSRAYLRWREMTAYGDPSPITTTDLIDFLAWRRRLRIIARGVT
jgi:hypothetical protein